MAIARQPLFRPLMRYNARRRSATELPLSREDVNETLSSRCAWRLKSLTRSVSSSGTGFLLRVREGFYFPLSRLGSLVTYIILNIGYLLTIPLDRETVVRVGWRVWIYSPINAARSL
jgi:hypothetical protein